MLNGGAGRPLQGPEGTCHTWFHGTTWRELPPSAQHANEHASVPESIPNHELRRPRSIMNEFFPPQHPEQPARPHGPSATAFDHVSDAALDQLQVHHSNWFVV